MLKVNRLSTIQHLELCLMLCYSLKKKGVWGRMDICICMAEFLHYSSEIITILLIGYTPIQNKKFKRKKNLAMQMHGTEV